jgi:hypothetical protein
VISQEGNLQAIAILAHNNDAVCGSIIQIIFHLRSCEWDRWERKLRKNVPNCIGGRRICCPLPDGDQRHGQRRSATILQEEEREEEEEAFPPTSKGSKPPPPPQTQPTRPRKTTVMKRKRRKVTKNDWFFECVMISGQKFIDFIKNNLNLPLKVVNNS